MPKNRKQTFSDRQSDASRAKKQAKKAPAKKKAAPDVNQIAASIVRKTTL